MPEEERDIEFSIEDDIPDLTKLGGEEEEPEVVEEEKDEGGSFLVLIIVAVVGLIAVIAVAVLVLCIVLKKKKDKGISQVTVGDTSEKAELEASSKGVTEDVEEKPKSLTPGMWYGNFEKP